MSSPESELSGAGKKLKLSQPLQMPPSIDQNSQKKTTNENSCVDRISDLPKNVIDYILEKLEIWDVVRTSVLSKKWKRNWTSLPQLTFSYLFTRRYKTCFEIVISRVLFQHIGPLPKFYLRLHSNIPDTSGMIIPWLCFLSKNGIRDLTLDYNYDHEYDEEYYEEYDEDGDLLILSSYFFSCYELRVLTLRSCLFKTPFAFNGFRSLTSFTCQAVTFEGLSFESLLQFCPLIQELTLDFCTGLGRALLIESPNLRIFAIDDYNDIEYISFKNTQNLSTMSIHLQGYAKERKKSNISEFFRCLRNLENLSLAGEHIVQMLSGGVAPKRLPSLLNFLKDLKLQSFDLCSLNVISCLLCMIRSSPNLQQLDIGTFTYIKEYSSSSEEDKAQILNYLQQQLDFLDCYLDHLQTIYVGKIYGSPPEMLVIKFLLAISPSLKKMVIHIHTSVAEKALWISKELLRFRRSSSAEVTLT